MKVTVNVINKSDFGNAEADEMRLDIAKRIANMDDHDVALTELNDMLRDASRAGEKARKRGDYEREHAILDYIDKLCYYIDEVALLKAYDDDLDF